MSNGKGLSMITPRSRRNADTVRTHINMAGRLRFDILLDIVQEVDQQAFRDLMPYPSLVGSAIHDGSIQPRSRQYTAASRGKQTFIFKPEELQAELLESESLSQSIFPLIKGTSSNFPSSHHFVVGRVAGNDIVMSDFTVSAQHARIMTSGDGYLIVDLGSTNGTRVNGERVGQSNTPLKDGDILTFARYDFAFLSPYSLYNLIFTKYLKRTHSVTALALF